MIDCRIDALLMGQVKPLGARQAPSGIDKYAVEGFLVFNELGFVDDAQGDLKAHGGVDKAIHHYPFDHYSSWVSFFEEKGLEIDGPDMSRPGAFGENISTVGFKESDVCLGDIFQLGSGVVQISQGRQPCWKLNERFSEKTMARSVQKTGRTGWYYRVLEEGAVQTGDKLQLKERLASDWDLARVTNLLYVDVNNLGAFEEMVKLPFLAASWKQLAERRLAKGEVEDWKRRLDGSE